MPPIRNEKPPIVEDGLRRAGSVGNAPPAVAMILAGGEGSRLAPLCEVRAKPAVPFAGQYRLIDFTLSNVMHSGIPYVGILTQYRPYSLMEHLANFESWGYRGQGRMAAILPPFRGESEVSWYAGTADAVYQNLAFIERFPGDAVLALSADHVYSMDYRPLLAFHEEHHADATIACKRVPWDQTNRFGVARVDPENRIADFQEKPSKDPISNMAALGIYVFRRHALIERLGEDAARRDSTHDFARDVIPRMIRDGRVFCYEFNGYWEDVGAILPYWEANLCALDPSTGLDLAKWDVRTNIQEVFPENQRPTRIARTGVLADCLAARGCYVVGRAEHSLLSAQTYIGPHAQVFNSVILNGARIEAGAVVRNAIVDKHASIGESAVVGEGETQNGALRVTVVGKRARIPKGIRIGPGSVIHSDVMESDFPARALPAGSITQATRGARPTFLPAK